MTVLENDIIINDYNIFNTTAIANCIIGQYLVNEGLSKFTPIYIIKNNIHYIEPSIRTCKELEAVIFSINSYFNMSFNIKRRKSLIVCKPVFRVKRNSIVSLYFKFFNVKTEFE
jgi:hypothetical protein